jgi:Ni/Co efflux regulator RcnB
MSKRTMTRLVSSILAAAALTVGVTAPAAQAASDRAADKGSKGQVVSFRDTGWD